MASPNGLAIDFDWCEQSTRNVLVLSEAVAVDALELRFETSDVAAIRQLHPILRILRVGVGEPTRRVVLLRFPVDLLGLRDDPEAPGRLVGRLDFITPLSIGPGPCEVGLVTLGELGELGSRYRLRLLKGRLFWTCRECGCGERDPSGEGLQLRHHIFHPPGGEMVSDVFCKKCRG